MALATLEFQDDTRDSIMSPPYWWGALGDLWEWTLLKYQHSPSVPQITMLDDMRVAALCQKV